MIKLSKEDDMRQLRIEVRGIPAYCMNIEECMSVEVEADGKPWYHDIKAYIKNSEYPSVAMDSEKKFIRRMACHVWGYPTQGPKILRIEFNEKNESYDGRKKCTIYLFLIIYK